MICQTQRRVLSRERQYAALYRPARGNENIEYFNENIEYFYFYFLECLVYFAFINIFLDIVSKCQARLWQGRRFLPYQSGH